jgi:hypothetical protein
LEEIMRETNNAATSILGDPDGAAAPTTPASESPVAGLAALTFLVPALVALGGGVGIVAAAVAFGAAETAVGVGTAYGLYLALSGRAGALAEDVRTVIRLIAVSARAHPTGGQGERPVE